MSELPPLTLSFPNAGDDIASQCDSALQLVMEAHRAGIVDAPAISLSDFSSETGADMRTSQLNPVRFQVIAQQLWLLGYMKDKPRSNISPTRQETLEFQNDLRRFQRDAGLVQDGWLGEKTWKALQELVSFESPIDPAHWQRQDGSYLTAFNRALQLRMWAYGCVENKPAYTFAGLKQNVLEKAERLVQMFCGPSCVDWRSALLDADQMLGCAVRTMANPDAVENDHKVKIRRLLISIARVELWLLGLDVDIDNSDDFPVGNFGVKRVRVRQGKQWKLMDALNKNLHQGLVQFWEELLGRSTDEAEELATALSLDFFQSLQSPENFAQDIDPFDEPDFSQEAAKILNTTEDIDEGFARFRSLGMKLWDGIKRIWRWLVKGVKKIVKVADNLIRGFFRFAAKSYVIVRTAFIALTSATEQYMCGRIDGTDPQVILIGKDFDYQTIVSVEHSATTAATAIDRFSSRFLFASRLIGLIVNLLTTAVQGVVGWARFLYVLVKSYRYLVPAYRALKAVV